MAIGPLISSRVEADTRSTHHASRTTLEVVSFRAFGAWKGAERVHDGNARTGATTETSPASLFLLLDSEAVVSGIELNYVGRLKRASLQLSDDGISWKSPPQQTRSRAGRHEITVPPISARSAMLRIEFEGSRFELREVTIRTPALDHVEVYGAEFVNVTEDAAEFGWKTSVPVKTNLLYGFSPDRMTTPGALSYEMTTDHRIFLTGLLPGTEYQAWILLGTNASAGLTETRPFSFRTRGAPYPFANAVSDATGRDTALIRFTTPIPARAHIEWKGTDGTRGVVDDERFLIAHAVALGGLRPRTTYDYEIVTEDTAHRRTATPRLHFVTKDNNVAIGAVATGTFDFLTDEQEAEDRRPARLRITDGRDDYFKGMATSGDPGETDQWIEVDLGREVELSSIETVWRGNAYPRNFYVMTSRDRVNWLYPGFGLDAGAGAEERSTRGDPLRRVAVAPANAEPIRYIKVFMTKGSAYFSRSPTWRFVQIAEIEAHGVWKE